MGNSLRFALSALALLLLAPLLPSTTSRLTADSLPASSKLSPETRSRAARPAGFSRVIIRGRRGTTGRQLRGVIEQNGGAAGRQLSVIDGQVAYVPNSALTALARDPSITHISIDRPVSGAIARTTRVIRARDVRQDFGYDGSGVGVAIIDSGVVASHADIAGTNNSRVVRFVDFVNGRDVPYDDYGHGTHVAGIIAGNGSHSSGAKAGVAPGSHLIVLKVLDETGTGTVSDVVAALDYVIENKFTLNIRVVNLSVAAGIHESYTTDPLALATQRAVAAGLVVIASAGNVGRDLLGVPAYGGISAPGNAPWVLTVGASSHEGTDDRDDDTIAPFSSRGPTALDFGAKPDIVAPGVGIESLSAPESALYARLSAYLLAGSVPGPFMPYLSLSGTSMAAPVVAGAVALMLQANPTLSPNQIKAILQYTARSLSWQDGLTQGAGTLNAKGAVELARYFARAMIGPTKYPSSSSWSERIVWGNQSIRGGRLTPSGTAWAVDVMWGAARTPRGENVSWGDICPDDECAWDDPRWTTWGATCSDETCTSVTWGAGTSRNVVWSSTCGGADCQGPWDLTAAGSSISNLSQAATVVWGTTDLNSILWGNTVVWGTFCIDPACEPVIWNRE